MMHNKSKEPSTHLRKHAAGTNTKDGSKSERKRKWWQRRLRPTFKDDRSLIYTTWQREFHEVFISEHILRAPLFRLKPLFFSLSIGYLVYAHIQRAAGIDVSLAPLAKIILIGFAVFNLWSWLKDLAVLSDGITWM